MNYQVIKWDGITPIDESAFKQSLADEGYSSYVWIDPPGAVYPLHTHTNDQSHWILSGQLELEIQGFGTVSLGPGDRDIMPANTQHSAKVISKTPVKYIIAEK